MSVSRTGKISFFTKVCWGDTASVDGTSLFAASQSFTFAVQCCFVVKRTHWRTKSRGKVKSRPQTEESWHDSCCFCNILIQKDHTAVRIKRFLNSLMNMENLYMNYAPKYSRDISHDCTRCTSFRNFWASDSVVKGRHSTRNQKVVALYECRLVVA